MEGFSYHDEDINMEREAQVTSSAMNSENDRVLLCGFMFYGSTPAHF